MQQLARQETCRGDNADRKRHLRHDECPASTSRGWAGDATPAAQQMRHEIETRRR